MKMACFFKFIYFCQGRDHIVSKTEADLKDRLVLLSELFKRIINSTENQCEGKHQKKCSKAYTSVNMSLLYIKIFKKK